jgi:hypothetical protein
MLERAMYLKPAIQQFILKHPKLNKYALTEDQWNKCGIVLAILRPFRNVSKKLQATKRPGIDKVFFYYESLFDQIDKVRTWMERGNISDLPWVPSLGVAVDKMAAKLAKYYKRTSKPFAYSDACILNPSIKMSLFEQPNWDAHHGARYKTACRRRYINNYEPLQNQRAELAMVGNKRKHSEISQDDDFDRFVQELHANTEQQNEFDVYINAPLVSLPQGQQSVLEWWGKNKDIYPGLALMARDTLAVPCTGAGVERIFSLSRRATPWTRNRLSAETIKQIMMYKDHLARQNLPSLDWEDPEDDDKDEIDVDAVDDVPSEWLDKWWTGLVHV